MFHKTISKTQGVEILPESKKYRDHIHAKGTDITVLSNGDENDYISLTDIARYKSDDPAATIQNWMRGRDVIEFLGLWEELSNPEFKPLEFEGFKVQAGANAFTMSPKKWVDSTNAIGIFLVQAATAVHLPIGILHLNLPPGSLRNLSCTSLRITSG
jgi:hypothetical protein